MSASPDNAPRSERTGGKAQSSTENARLYDDVVNVQSELDLIRLWDDVQGEILDAGLAEYQ